MSTSYGIYVEEFAERHFIKTFRKKYKGAWEVTFKAMQDEFQRMDSLLETSVAEEISCFDTIRICKTEFRIAGTKESRKSSGNRCIVAIHGLESVVRILFVYNKTDIHSAHETSEWKKIIKENYPIYRDFL